jgi:hypothetical protein
MLRLRCIALLVLAWLLLIPKPAFSCKDDDCGRSDESFVGLLTALRHIGGYDIFGGDVIVQRVFTANMNESFVFLPHNPPKSKNWKLQVFFKGDKFVRVETSNISKTNAPSGSPNQKRHSVVIRATSYMHAQNCDDFPSIIKFVDLREKYWVAYTRIPFMPEGISIIEVSKDLKKAHWR